MRTRQLLVFTTALAFALPAVADWPSGARTGFVAECIENAQASHDARQAKLFCECAADEASNEFSQAELEQMSQGMNGEMEQRLIESARSCSGNLEG